jgi:chaperone BCS1
MREKIESTFSNQAYREVFVFQTFAQDRQIIIDLIEEARLLAFPPDDNSIAIMKDIYGSWHPVMKRLPRSIDSIILQKGIIEDILQDVTDFLNSGEWYQKLGIPYQRGYLLYGPPGNGKTSLVHAIASETKRDVYILKVSATTDEAIQCAMGKVSENGIVLLEDVDCAFEARDSQPSSIIKKDNDFLTLSGFLNAIDGISAHEGRLLFMTTNFKEKLDPALIRPGRVDREYFLDNASQDQAYRLFLRFFPGFESGAKKFSESVSDDIVSMASLQGHLLKHRKNVKKAQEWCHSERLFHTRGPSLVCKN